MGRTADSHTRPSPSDTLVFALGQSMFQAFMKTRPHAPFGGSSAFLPPHLSSQNENLVLPHIAALPQPSLPVAEQPEEQCRPPFPLLFKRSRESCRQDMPSENPEERVAQGVLASFRDISASGTLKAPAPRVDSKRKQPVPRLPKSLDESEDSSEEDTDTSTDERVPMKERVYTIPSGASRGGGGRRYACRTCDRPFKRKCHVYDHIRRIHDKIRPYPCSQCDHTFPQKSSRDRHVQIVHEKKKPHVCDQCQKAFGKKNALTVHIRTVHRKERPFDCPICSATFGVRSHLNKHVRIVHNRSKPYVCDKCNISFGERAELNQHRWDIHFIKEEDTNV